MRFGAGLQWRCRPPQYFCEVQNAGNVPVYNDKALATRIKEVRNFYASRITNLGLLNSFGYGIDVLVANSFAESSGTVPSPLNLPDVEAVYAAALGSIPMKLDAVAKHIRNTAATKNLAYFEPGYANPVNTPGKISMGSHHQLISTAAWLQTGKNTTSPEQVATLVKRLPTESRFSAGLAVIYFNKKFSQHNNQPPLLAACYNAGSLRVSGDNAWNLRCTNNHIDRWVRFYNMSRAAVNGAVAPRAVQVSPVATSSNPVLPPPTSTNVNTTSKNSVENILSVLQRKNYNVRTDDDKDFNLNLVGIRHNNARVNYFDDFLFVFWKYKGVWLSRQYNITTYPGKDYLGEKSVNRLGTAILKEGHYPNSHQVGFHKVSSPSRYEALVHRGKLTVYRDNNHDGKFDLRPETLDTGTGFGVNIHRARSGGVTVNVGPYSAGCQVFASFEQWTDFHKLFKKAETNWGKNFHYSLINANDF